MPPCTQAHQGTSLHTPTVATPTAKRRKKIIVLAARLRARAVPTTTLQNRFAPSKQRGRRSAERRIVVPIAACATAHPWLDAPACRRFTAALATGSYPDGSSPEPGFPTSQTRGCFARLPLAAG